MKFMKIDQSRKGYYSYDDVYEMFKPLMQKIAGKYSFMSVEYEDIMQELSINLYQAYNKYSNTEIGFSLFVQPYLKYGAILYLKKCTGYRKTIKDTDIELLSLESFVYDEGKQTQHDACACSYDIEEDITDKVYLEQITRCLTECELLYLKEYYLNDTKQTDIAKKYNKGGQVHVSRVIKKAVDKLRNQAVSVI